MAKRLSESAARSSQDSALQDPDVCRICGGMIVEEESRRPPAEYPRRRVCRTCDAEYRSTVPASVKY